MGNNAKGYNPKYTIKVGSGKWDKMLERYGLLNYQTREKNAEQIQESRARFENRMGTEIWDSYAEQAWGDRPSIANLFTPNDGGLPNQQSATTQQIYGEKGISLVPETPTVTFEQVKSGQAGWSLLTEAQKQQIFSDPEFYKTGLSQFSNYQTQQEILADPGFWSNPNAAQLPKGHKLYYDFSSSNPELFAAGQGAVTAAISGAPNPAGIATGAVLGYAAQLSGYDPAKNFWEQWDKQGSLAGNLTRSAFGLLNFLSEEQEKFLGFAAQAAASAYDPERYGSTRDLFRGFGPDGKQWSAWQAGANFYETLAPVIAEQRIGLEDQVSPVVTIYQTIGALLNPDANKGKDYLVGQADAVYFKLNYLERLREARKQIDAGRNYREVNLDYQQYMGAQIADTVLQGLLDPLNVLPYVRNKGIAKLAEVTGNEHLAKTFREHSYLGTNPKASAIAGEFHADAVRSPDLHTYTGFEKWYAGLTKEGKIREGGWLPTSSRALLDTIPGAKKGAGLISKVGRWLDRMSHLTPESKADLGGTLLVDGLGARMADMPIAELKQWVARLGNVDPEQLAGVGEAMGDNAAWSTLQPFTKEEILKSVIDPEATRWEGSAPQRDMLARLSAALNTEPGKLIETWKNGSDAADWKRILNAAAADPSLKADIENGILRPESLGELGKLFDPETGIAWHEGAAKAEILRKVQDAYETWAVQHFGIEQDSWGIQMAQALKSAQSILMLGANPGYALTNVMNGITTGLIDGKMGYMTQANINKWLDRFGAAPSRMGEGTDIANQSTTGRDAGALRKAKEPTGALGNMTRGIKWLSSKMPFSKLASMGEAFMGRQIFAKAMGQYWANAWRAGKGFEKMPAALVNEIRRTGLDPEFVHRTIEGGLNFKEIEDNLYGRKRELKSRAMINDAAERLGIEPNRAAQMMEELGVLNTLDDYLMGTKTAEQINAAYRKAMGIANQRRLINLQADLVTEIEHVKNTLDIHEAIGIVDVTLRAQEPYFDTWWAHYDRMDNLWAGIEDDPAKAMTQKEHAYNESARAFQEVKAWQAATWKAILEKMGQDDSPFGRGVLSAMAESDLALGDAYTKMLELERNHFEEYKGKPYKEAQRARLEMKKQVDKIFQDAFKVQLDSQRKLAELYRDFYGKRYNPAAGQAAHRMWKDIIDFRSEMLDRLKQHREGKTGLLSKEFYPGVYLPMIGRLEAIYQDGAKRLTQVIKGGDGSTPTTPIDPNSPPPTPPTGMGNPIELANFYMQEAAREDAMRQAETATATEQARAIGLQYPGLDDHPKHLRNALRNVEYGGDPSIRNLADAMNKLGEEGIRKILDRRNEVKQAKNEAELAKAIRTDEVRAEMQAIAGEYSKMLPRNTANFDLSNVGDLGHLKNILKNYTDATDLPAMWEALGPDGVRLALDEYTATQQPLLPEAQARAAEIDAAQADAARQQAEQRAKARKANSDKDILTAIVEMGGLTREELQLADANKRRPGLEVKARKNRIALNEIPAALAERGYPIDLNDPADPDGINQMREMISRNLAGEKIYPADHAIPEQDIAAQELQHYADQLAAQELQDQVQQAVDNTDEQLSAWQERAVRIEEQINAGELDNAQQEIETLFNEIPEEMKAEPYNAFGDTFADMEDQLRTRLTDRMEEVRTDEAIQRNTREAEAAINAIDTAVEAHIRRSEFIDQVVKVAEQSNNLTAEQARAWVEGILDGAAEYYARQNGVHPDEFYARLQVEGDTPLIQGDLLQTVFHGSPYKFDKFSLDHMGKGEGVQAYGWGLYFAGDKAVAEFYRQKLAGQGKGVPAHNTIDGVRVTNDVVKSLQNDPRYGQHVQDFFRRSHAAKWVAQAKDIRPWIDAEIRNFTGTRDKMLASAEERRANPNTITGTYSIDDYERIASNYQKAIDQLQEIKTRFDFVPKKEGKPKGQLYAVDIPDDGYLLWDRPLDEQPQDVQDKLRAFFERDELHTYMDQWETYRPDETGYMDGNDEYMDGQEIYHALSNMKGGKKRNPKAASLALKEAGINGIKYLDGSSRSKGEGNYNYVIFDDAATNILETFYQSAPTPDALTLFQTAFHASPHKFNAERLVWMPDGNLQYITGEVGKLPELPEGATLVRDFPLGRFRSDKINTGEGAQAFGWGLYVGENRSDLDAMYRDRLVQRMGPGPSAEAKYKGSNKHGYRMVMHDDPKSRAIYEVLREMESGRNPTQARNAVMKDLQVTAIGADSRDAAFYKSVIAEVKKIKPADLSIQRDEWTYKGSTQKHTQSMIWGLLANEIKREGLTPEQAIQKNIEHQEEIIKRLDEQDKDKPYYENYRAYVMRQLERYKKLNPADFKPPEIQKNTGQLYKVDIPDDNYLLWDAPMKDQPQAIRDSYKPEKRAPFTQKMKNELADLTDIINDKKKTPAGVEIDQIYAELHNKYGEWNRGQWTPEEKARYDETYSRFEKEREAAQERFDKLSFMPGAPLAWRESASAYNSSPVYKASSAMGGYTIKVVDGRYQLISTTNRSSVTTSLTETGLKALMKRAQVFDNTELRHYTKGGKIQSGADYYKTRSKIYEVELKLQHPDWTPKKLHSEADKKVSLELNAAGVNGIKFLDGSSRSKGSGTYNYVIFDDKAIEVMDTYYQQAKGAIEIPPMPDMAATIKIFKTGDFSTLVHEGSHAFYRYLNDADRQAVHEYAESQLKVFNDARQRHILTDAELNRINTEGQIQIGTDTVTQADVDSHRYITQRQLDAFYSDGKGGYIDIATALDENGNATRATHEMMARGFERYVYEGSTPSTRIGQLFKQMKDWMINIYRKLRGSEIDLQLSPEIRDVFDRMTSGENAPSLRDAGQDSRAPELQLAQTQSKAPTVTDSPTFRAWFKESKVKDQAGEPIVMYHSGEFDETVDPVPQINGEGFHFGTEDAARERAAMKPHDDFIQSLEIEEQDGRWYWTALITGESSFDFDKDFSSEKAAFNDASEAAKEYADSMMGDGDMEPNITEVYLAIQNPKRMKDQGGDWRGSIEQAKAEGYDGIVYTNQYEDKGSESWIAFYPEQIKSVNNRGTWSKRSKNVLFQGDGDQLPAGALDQAEGKAGQLDSQVQRDGWTHYVTPLMDAMREAHIKEASTRPLDGASLDLSPEGMAMLRKYMAGVKESMASTKLATMRYGENQRDFSLLNYGKRYGMDKYLDVPVPYQFFQTRSALTWAARALDRPAIMANYARLMRAQSRYEREQPERLRGKIKIAAPYLPDWMGDSVYIDPMRTLFTPVNFLQPLATMQKDSNYQEIEAERILQEWASDGTYNEQDVIKAAQQRSGDVWERAMAEASVRREKQIGDPLEFLSTMLGPAWYLQAPAKAMGLTVPFVNPKGEGPEGISPLPIVNTSRAIDQAGKGTWAEPITSTIGLIGKADAWARKQTGLPEFGKLTDYYIQKQLAIMVADGTIANPDDAKIAMVERQGELWDEATERVRLDMAMRVPGAQALYAGLHGDSFFDGMAEMAKALPTSLFSAQILPEGELEYYGLKDDWKRALDAKDKGDNQAVNNFFDAHPEYEVWLAKSTWADPEKQLRQLLIGQIWDGYMGAGESNKRQAREAMDAATHDLFSQAFLNPETRDYNAMTTEQLVQLARMLNQRVPETPQTAPVLEQPAPEVNYLAPEVTAITDRFFEERKAKYPNYYTQQSEYYALGDKTARSRYLITHPELQDYFNWKQRWYKNYPEFVPVFNGEVSKQMDTSSWNPMLVEAVQHAALTGDKLGRGAMDLLKQKWYEQGQPYGDFMDWYERDVIPAMKNGMR